MANNNGLNLAAVQEMLAKRFKGPGLKENKSNGKVNKSKDVGDGRNKSSKQPAKGKPEETTDRRSEEELIILDDDDSRATGGSKRTKKRKSSSKKKKSKKKTKLRRATTSDNMVYEYDSQDYAEI